MDGFKINQDFAKKYDKYRQKEELQKLKSRYGEDAELESETSESEDDNAEAITPGLERDFLRTLAYLKKKDPAIYDKSKHFYEEHESSDGVELSSENERQKKVKPMLLKDYERKMVLENEGKFVEDATDDEEEREIRETSPSYQEEQLQLKEDLKKAISSSVIPDDNEDDGLLTKRTKSSKEKEEEEGEFRKWLKTPEASMDLGEVDGESETAGKEKSVKQEVAPLKQYWTDPDLDEGEKFLRDYILERKYLDPNADGEMPTYDEIVGAESNDEISDGEDELFEKRSEMFEHKYNFRFEEVDEDFIKQYPRTIGTSVRRKDDARKKKREEKKKHDEEKKRKKQEELKELKLLKKKEILDKIQKLQQATGNKDIAFSEADLEVDFDPELHDKRMQEIFSNYDEDFEEEKPVFSDIENEMEDYERYWEEDEAHHADSGNYGVEGDDPGFIMDCDYDPAEHRRQKEERKNRKKPNADEKEKKTKKSVILKSVTKPKPTFDPNEKSFEKYLDEYYAMDYEDLIGDLPCRFKYRQVVPNDFGLDTDEILTATDKELNTWCSLKRTVQYRKDEDERMDVRKYRKKGSNVWKKARVLKSVYKMPGEDEDDKDAAASLAKDDNERSGNNQEPTKRKKMNSRKRRRLKERAAKMRQLTDDAGPAMTQYNVSTISHSHQRLSTKAVSISTAAQTKDVKRSKIKGKGTERVYDKVAKLSEDRLKAYGLQPKKFLKKMRYSEKNGTTF